MSSQSSEKDFLIVHSTLLSINEALVYLLEWNKEKTIAKADDYLASPGGMKELAANAMLICAIGEGINKINKVAPDFLNSNFPDIPWKEIVGMRNHIAHGYFEIDAGVVFDAVNDDLPVLKGAIEKAIEISGDL